MLCRQMNSALAIGRRGKIPCISSRNDWCVLIAPVWRKELVMQLEQLMETLPEYAKDLKLNYSTLVRHNADLTPQQLWGTMLACACSLCCETLTQAVLEDASLYLTPQAAEAAKSAAAIIG